MPRATQIAPEYKQPHVATYINDNTKYTEDIVSVDNNVKFLSVFRSYMGPDNVIIKVKKLNDFINMYGESDFSKYGQPLLMPIAELTSGIASVHCMRIMPTDATYANVIVSALYKTDKDAKKMTIKYHSEYLAPSDHETGAITEDLVKAAFVSAASDTPDDNGFKKIPLFYITMAGRGVYGNDFRFRVSREASYEKDYGIKMFSFEALQVNNGINSLANYVGSLVTSTRHVKTTFITDIMEDYDPGESYFKVNVDEANVEKLYTEFVTFVNSLAEEDRGEIMDLDRFDPFFGYGMNNKTVHENLEILSVDPTDDAVIAIDSAEGTGLHGGTDGSFATGTEESIQSAIEKAYIAAFNGSLDSTILSSRRTPLDIILDANYPKAVKKQLFELATVRNDCPVVFDAGIISSEAEIDNAIADFAYINTYQASKEFQHYKIRDPRTYKKIDVTMTYFWATSFAAHIKTYGDYIPFVKRYATLSGHVKNSVVPAVELYQMDLKEKLYDARFNYFETTDENVFVRSVQNTAQPDDSDLLEENNVRVLYNVKKMVEDDCIDNLFNFADAAQRADFSAYEQAKFNPWIGQKFATFSIIFDMNEWELERSILHCYIAIQFRTLNKRTIIEIDVNKRSLTN